MSRLVERFGDGLGPYPEAERERILAAAAWAEQLHRDQKRDSGEPYLTHPLAVAEILVELKLDATAVTAGLLHDVLEDTPATAAEVNRRFGPEVELLVDGVTKISHIPTEHKSVQGSETIRKMLFAMIRDIRVILIKLADKLHNMRTLDYLDRDRAEGTAEECLEIYAPLAGRMGIFSVKNELEDLALKTLNPRAFKQIRDFVAERQDERAGYLDRITHELIAAGHRDGIEIDVKARAKHFYSIYQKMRRRNVPLDEMYDLLGIRTLCASRNECYGLLGVVHKLWKPIAGRFKDYIAMPKANGYQSLHTVVMGPEGRLIELQIRTQEMNEKAEYGIAAHWLYKQGGTAKPVELTIVNRLRAWDEAESHAFLDEIKSELLKESIYVFTPKGEVIELPVGATPIDFAFYIHTEIGNHMQGARVDGRICPLKKPLRNTQVVEVLTSSAAKPHLSWLRQCKTHRARSKIRQWLNHHEPGVTIDRNIVVRHAPPPPARKPAHRPDMEVLDRSRVGVRIGKERNILIKMAGCCTPRPGDAIIGYVSWQRGIIVHRRNCHDLQYIPDFQERSIEVEWETVSPLATRRFRITAREAPDIFAEIEGAIRKQQGHLISGRLAKNDRGMLTGSFTIEVDDREQFRRMVKNLRTIPAIVNIQPLADAAEG